MQLRSLATWFNYTALAPICDRWLILMLRFRCRCRYRYRLCEVASRRLTELWTIRRMRAPAVISRLRSRRQSSWHRVGRDQVASATVQKAQDEYAFVARNVSVPRWTGIELETLIVTGDWRLGLACLATHVHSTIGTVPRLKSCPCSCPCPRSVSFT